ncbi:MAG: CatA-like O-acetyltransferase [Rhodobacteraceae bacterium]|jgi:chloramphenicol O-acetyltransferase type A|nr:CatA-like O-acetyltransferase [Paracoccaceae bacterium]
MTATPIDLATWPRADQFRLFRGYERPHYAVTARLDTTRLTALRRERGVSLYRAILFAAGTGLHAVPELMTRFRGETVVRHDRVALSITVATDAGSFAYVDVPFVPDFAAFDRDARTRIEAARTRRDLGADDGSRDAVAYLSSLPWLDFTAITNAMPGPDDCIPRVSWGKVVGTEGGASSVAMAIEVHHALVDGAHVGGFFAAVQAALDALDPSGP